MKQKQSFYVLVLDLKTEVYKSSATMLSIQLNPQFKFQKQKYESPHIQSLLLLKIFLMGCYTVQMQYNFREQDFHQIIVCVFIPYRQTYIPNYHIISPNNGGIIVPGIYSDTSLRFQYFGSDFARKQNTLDSLWLRLVDTPKSSISVRL